MKLLTLTGPSCSGKTTLLNELVANHGFKALVSHTSRPPRQGEIEGKDYFFVSNEKFEDIKMAGKLMENIEFNGYKYGVSANEVANATLENKNSVLIVEPQGLKQISKYAKLNNIELVRVYINGNLIDLISRYLQRSSSESLQHSDTANRHARRIESLFSEHRDWPNTNEIVIEPGFMAHKSIYDLFIPEYNESNQKEHINTIKELYGQS